MGKTDFDFFDEEHARQADEAERAILATGQPLIAAETKLTWPDGQVGWVSTTKMPLPDEKGNIIGTFGISRDITERKRADDERNALFDIMRGLSSTANLQEYLQLIRQSLNTVLDAKNFFVVLRDNRSGLFEEVFAVDEYDAPMPPSGLEKSITSYVYRSGEPLLLTAATFEDLLARGDVELIGAKPASWLGAPLRASAQTIGVIAVQNYEDPGCYSARDRDFLASAGTQVAAAIARMQAEKAAKESELRYRNLVEMSPDAIAVHQNGKFVYVNQAGARLFGAADAQELTGKPVLDIVHPEDRGKALGRIGDTSAGAVAPLTEQKFMRLDGEPIDVEVAAIPFVFDGQPATQVVVRDVTERKQAEESLRPHRRAHPAL